MMKTSSVMEWEHKMTEPNTVAFETHLFMSTLLELQADRWLDMKRVDVLRDKLGIVGIADKIYFYRELVDIARRIPMRVFSDNGVRIKFIESLQKLLDDAIEEEG